MQNLKQRDQLFYNISQAYFRYDVSPQMNADADELTELCFLPFSYDKLMQKYPIKHGSLLF